MSLTESVVWVGARLELRPTSGRRVSWTVAGRRLLRLRAQRQAPTRRDVVTVPLAAFALAAFRLVR